MTPFVRSILFNGKFCMENDSMSKPWEISCLDKVLRRMKVSYSCDSITLEERGDEAALRNIDVSGLTPDYLVLKPDESRIQFFASGYGSKQCDYILLSEFNGEKVAVFVELKSNVGDHSAIATTPQQDADGEYDDYVTQLISSSCLLDYLHSVLVNFCNCDVLGKDYKRYYVVLHNKDIPLIDDEVLLTRPERNTSPQQAYIRKTNNNESLTLADLIR